jgi:cytochrome c oxidase subunit III
MIRTQIGSNLFDNGVAMPVTFTRNPVDTERKDPGIGGKPPVSRRPTGGGGDGDNWDGQRGRSGPRQLLTRWRLGIFFALVGDMLFFVAIVSSFFVSQGGGHLDPRTHDYVSTWHPISVPSILWLNTALLVISSFTMEMGRRQLFREIDVMEEWLGLGRPALRRAIPWLVATAVAGSLFLLGQWVAWKQMWTDKALLASDPARYFFYLITGAHGIHLIFGILALVAALGSLAFLRRVEYRQILVDCTAWYWHSMGVFWLFLFALLVFAQ